MKHNRIAVFDLDGTLLNTLQDLTNSVNFAMQELSLPTCSCGQVRQMIGNGVAVLMQRAVTQLHADLHAQALCLQRKFYQQHGLENTLPFDGVPEMLSALKNRGVSVIVHTNKDENVAKQLCEKFFGNLVDYVCGTTSDALVKPNAQRLLAVLATFGDFRAVYAGDSDVDLQTAKNANIPCISVTWGFRSKEFLLSCGANCLVDSPLEVPDLVQKLLD